MESEEIPEIDPDNIVVLSLEFLLSMFMREGTKLNYEVVQGIPEGANAIGAGIVENQLIIEFDRPVPQHLWFKDLTESPIKLERTEIN